MKESSPPFDPDAPLPKVASVLLNRFEVGNFLGAGGMGLVYSGIDKETGNRVAIKTPKPGCPYGEFLRFIREAELQIPKHPSLANHLDRFIEGERPYSISEQIEGRSLCEILQARLEASGPQSPVEVAWFKPELSISVAVKAMIDICQAVALLHQEGIVHRDLKPGNYVWHPDGRAVLIDFGLAFQESDKLLSKPDQVGGTTAYMAPEQWRGQANSDSRADIYSLGASLMHLLSGNLPVGTPKTGEDFDGNPLPRGLLQIIQKAMERNCRFRFQTAEAMAVALQHWLEHRTPVPGLDSTIANFGRWIRQRRFRITAAFAALAFCSAVVLAFLVIRGSVDRGTLAGIAFGSARAKDEVLLYGTLANHDALIKELFNTYQEVIRLDPQLKLEVSQFARRRAMRLALGTGEHSALPSLVKLLPRPGIRGWSTVEDYRLNACAFAVAGEYSQAVSQLEMVAQSNPDIAKLANLGKECLLAYEESSQQGIFPQVVLASGDSTSVYGWPPELKVGVASVNERELHQGQLWLSPKESLPGSVDSSLIFRTPRITSQVDGVSFATVDLNQDGLGEIYFKWSWNKKTGAGLILSDASGRILTLNLATE